MYHHGANDGDDGDDDDDDDNDDDSGDGGDRATFRGHCMRIYQEAPRVVSG
jgi:hypothetical protein